MKLPNTYQQLFRSLVIAMACFAWGCASADTNTGEQFLTNALPSVSDSDWDSLTVGCAGQLGVNTSFHIAEGAPELLVAENEEGLVCVDSFDAIESELSNIDPQAGNDLWLAYVATLQEVSPYTNEIAGADAASLPVPETNLPGNIAGTPVPETNQPVPETNQPVPETNQPVPETNEPVPETNQPVPETNEPVPETNEPVPETNEPVPETIPVQQQ